MSSLGAGAGSLREALCPPGFPLEGLPVCGHTLASVLWMNEGGQEGASRAGWAPACVQAAACTESNVGGWPNAHLELLCSRK